MTASPAAAPPVAGPTKSQRRKLLTAGLVGSSIEWYDFFIFGTAAALVFPKIFFPGESALTATLLSFGTFWAAFIARPVGGVIAGHYGDKLGRKPVVVTCLYGMGAATFVIGLLPGAGTLGIAAPIILVLLRFVQGLAAGGQWGGIVLLLTESEGPKKRGFAGTFGQMGVPIGVLLGNMVFLTVSHLVTTEQFVSWGWRIPFLLSIVLFPVALFIHNKVEDSPEFRALATEVAAKKADQPKVVQAPLAEVVRKAWKRILLGSFMLGATNAYFYISIVGLLNYGTEGLGMERDTLLGIALITSVFSVPMILFFGHLSDRVGRRMLVAIGGIGLAVWAFPYFGLINTADPKMIFLAGMVAVVFQNMIYGPLAAYMAEIFAANVRFSGMSLAYQIAAIVFSGGTPMIMTAIIDKTGSTTGVSISLLIFSVLTAFAAFVLPETNPKEVREDPNAVPGMGLTEETV